jgi:membrane-bound lytic murein transglycosylase A
MLLFFSSCARAPLKNIEDSMRKTTLLPIIQDSMPIDKFLIDLVAHITEMKHSTKVTDPLIFGNQKIKKSIYIEALEEILKHQDELIPWISTHFDLYEVYGREHWGEVLTTGYYEPIISGSHEQTSVFSQPLYALPPDIVIAYLDRKSIDVDKKLEGRNLELAWVNPIDAFLIQVQGSGMVEFSATEKIHLGYAGKNGQPYMSIGKFLTDKIPLEQMTMQKICAHLETLSKVEQQEIFNKNPSYVFFRKLDGGALTTAGMVVSAERTIATDINFFPKGALAFLDIADPLTQVRKPRLVFDQDTGGAIKGGGHIDLYFGAGEEAYQKAGIMKQIGRLYYLVPKNYK